MVPDGDVFILRSIGDDLNEATDLCLGIQRHTEQLWRGHRQQLHQMCQDNQEARLMLSDLCLKSV